MKMYDAFQEDCIHAMKKVAEARTAEERIKASLELTRMKVDYYEEHFKAPNSTSKSRKQYEQPYITALWGYQAIIDEAEKAGVCLDGMLYSRG